MDRDDCLNRLKARSQPLDVLVIGGGATGASVALDAAARGFSIALLEQHDFGKGTSSRSTKLVHGGVRYLAQGNVSLVREALQERSRLRENAPHVVHEMAFVVPCDNWRQRWWYGLGFKLYDMLAGNSGFQRSRPVSQSECLSAVPTLKPHRASGGVIYSDGQFDDSRLLLNILQTAVERGAIVANYAKVDRILKDDAGRATGVMFTNLESGESIDVNARCVINATGPFCDQVRTLDQPDCQRLVAASQGVHVVLPRRFLPGETAVIVPKTNDGRVIFMIPWHEHVVVGTTDTLIPEPDVEPRASAEEIEFLLTTAAEYLTEAPTRGDVLSVFTGIRPLVGKQPGQKTATLSRDHVIQASSSGMITITGGKWTTARKMGEECVDRAIQWNALEPRPCQTARLRLHGAAEPLDDTDRRSVYGSDLVAVDALAESKPEWGRELVEDFPLRGAEVVWAVRSEMARTVEDVLARRTRLLFLNAQAALDIAPEVARLMAVELGCDADWQAAQVAEFEQVAANFQL